MPVKSKSNVLDSAKKVETARERASGPSIPTPGILNLAAIQAMEKIVKELKTTVETPIKDEALNYFVRIGCASGRRPPNYNGIEDGAHSSIQLKKRSSQYTLDEGQIDYLKLYGVETETVTEYVLNSKYVIDDKIIARLNKAGLPADIFEKREKTVTTEQSIHQAFQYDDPVVAKEVLQLVTAPITIRAVIENTSAANIIARVYELLTG